MDLELEKMIQDEVNKIKDRVSGTFNSKDSVSGTFSSKDSVSGTFSSKDSVSGTFGFKEADKLEFIQFQAREKIRKEKEPTKININRFNEFIQNSGVIHRDGNDLTNFYHWQSWDLEDLEDRFWNYIDNNGGFSVCPSCNLTPKINRIIPRRKFTPTMCVEGLYSVYNNGYPRFLPIQSINCCEWLYEFSTQKVYILVSKLKYTFKEKVKFNTLKFYNSKPRYGNDCEITYFDDYTEYDESDPDGECAYKEKLILDIKEEIRILKEKLSSEESKLQDLISKND